MEFIMSIMKKIAVAVFAASLFILSSCKETEEIKIADVSATVGESHFFNKKAVAKVSDDADKGESKITAIFGNDGTMIYAGNTKDKEAVIITYAGKRAGTYSTGMTAENAVNTVLDYLFGPSTTLTEAVKGAVKSNVTYIDAEGNKWYSTTCKVVIHGQENGAKLSLINGSFEATVYKSATESKTISGTISNVVGLN